MQWLVRQGYEKERKALKWAVRGEHTEVIEWLLRLESIWKVPYPAARYGQMKVLEKVMRKNRLHGGIWVAEAAAGGRVDVLKWLARHGNKNVDRAMAIAAEKGHLEVFKWAAGKGGIVNVDSVVPKAAYRGHLAIIEWLCDQGCACATRAWRYAAQGGHLHVLAWCIAWAQIKLPAEEVVTEAARNGHVEILEWFYRLHAGREDTMKAIRIPEEAMIEVAGGGYVRVLEWLEAHGIKAENERWAIKGSEEAAKGGHVNVLAWMAMRGLEWDRIKCCETAASRGDLDTLEWLFRECGCSWTEEVSVKATQDTQAAQWALENGCGEAGKAYAWA